MCVVEREKKEQREGGSTRGVHLRRAMHGAHDEGGDTTSCYYCYGHAGLPGCKCARTRKFERVFPTIGDIWCKCRPMFTFHYIMKVFVRQMVAMLALCVLRLHLRSGTLSLMVEGRHRQASGPPPA